MEFNVIYIFINLFKKRENEKMDQKKLENENSKSFLL